MDEPHQPEQLKSQFGACYLPFTWSLEWQEDPEVVVCHWSLSATCQLLSITWCWISDYCKKNGRHAEIKRISIQAITATVNTVHAQTVLWTYKLQKIKKSSAFIQLGLDQMLQSYWQFKYKSNLLIPIRQKASVNFSFSATREDCWFFFLLRLNRLP